MTGGVTWRRAVAVLAAVAVAAVAVVVVGRADGFPASDAVAARATRWFAHRASGRIVLADGYAGVGLARLDLAEAGAPVSVADGGGDAYVLDPTTGDATAIDTAALRLGSPSPVGPLAGADPVAGVAPEGLIVVNPSTSQAALVAPSGEETAFEVEVGTQAVVAPDGALWSIDDETLVRTAASGAVDTVDLGVSDLELTLVGSQPVVLDRTGRRLRTGGDGWVELPTQLAPSELVLQRPGPAAPCAWVGADDDLWCVGDDDVEETTRVRGLGIDGADQLAVAGDAAAIVRRAPTEIVRFDWRSGEVLDDVVASVDAGAALEVTSTPDLVWVDDADGDQLWAVNPWGIRAIRKDDQAILALGEEGTVVVDDQAPPGDGASSDDQEPDTPQPPEPDDDGIDDPPVAVDDDVRARAGTTVAVAVTANDFDPDGEAVVVTAATPPRSGTTTVVSAATVSYTPSPGFSGVDTFGYTIVDGNGTEATATVTVRLVGPDAVNGAPRVVDDAVDTGAGVPVVIEVLANDLDPERDVLRIAEFTAPSRGGTVSEVIGPSGRPALRFEPDPAFSGEATLSYRAADGFDAVSTAATVRIAVADAGSENRPPVTQPDAVRVRRNVAAVVPVLINDRDPDGDVPLTLTLVDPLPPALDVVVEGEQLRVTARAGSTSLLPFTYQVDDGNGGVARGSVLVYVEDAEANRPPLLNPDAAFVVAGTTVAIDVLDNDIDPDGDPLVVVAAGPPDLGGRAVVTGNEIRYSPPPGAIPNAPVRFTYSVTDGAGHEVRGDVSVRVLAEPPLLPPFTRDDSASTYVDQAVDIDVLGNDGDPSGATPILAGAPSCPTGVVVSVTPSSRVRFVPPPGLTGVVRCTYQVANSLGLTANGDIVVTVQEPPVVNQPPIVVGEEVTVETGTEVTVDVLANDRDPDGAPGSLTVASSSVPTLGQATRQGGTITFRAPAASGVATITYDVVDVDGAVSVGQLTVRVLGPGPVAPIAADDARTITGPGVATSFDVLANDVDPDTTSGLTVAGAELVAGPGSVSASGSIVTLSPPADFVGEMVASYTIADADGLTATAAVRLTVESPLNRPPLPADDRAAVNAGATVTIDVLRNDRDPDNDPLTVSLLGDGGGQGDVSLAGSTITFRAGVGAAGAVTIPYRVSDGELAADATVVIEVRACDVVPDAPDVSLFTGYQQPLFVDLTSYARNGTVAQVDPPLGAPSGTYTPPAGENGNVSFDYVVEGACDRRDTGRVTIDVNRDPSAGGVAVSMRPGEQRTIAVGELGTDDEPLSVTALAGAPGWVSISSGGLELRPDRGGDVSFAVTVSDPGGLSAQATVTVSVTNGAPVANADQADVSAGAVDVDLLVNDSDPDGDVIGLQSVPGSANFDRGGRLTITTVGPRTVRLTPAGRAAGTATFTYTIVDASGRESNAATVTVFSQPPPPATTTTTTPPQVTTTTVRPPATTTTTLPPAPTTTRPPATTTTTQPPTTPPPPTTTLPPVTTTTAPPTTTTTPPTTTTTTTTTTAPPGP